MKVLLKKVIKLSRSEITYFMHKPRRILFDHVPKCAGTTITEYLLQNYSWRVAFLMHGGQPTESVKKFQSLPQDRRYSYSLISGHLAHELLDYVHPETIKCTLLREPVDRIVSHYFYVKRRKEHYLHDQIVQSNMQLEDYASSAHSIELRNYYTTHFTGMSIEEAENQPEESVKRAADVILKKYDIVGFQDDVPSFLHRLRDAAYLQKPYENSVENKTSGRIGVREISDTAREAISRTNFLDIELYKALRSEK